MFDYAKTQQLQQEASKLDTIPRYRISLDDKDMKNIEDLHLTHVSYINHAYKLDTLFTNLSNQLFLYEYIKNHGLSQHSYEMLCQFTPYLISKISTEDLSVLPSFSYDQHIAVEGIKQGLMNIVEGVDTFIHRGVVKLAGLFGNTFKFYQSYYDKIGKIEKLLNNTLINEKYYHKMLLKGVLSYSDLSKSLDEFSDIVKEHENDLLSGTSMLKSFNSIEDFNEFSEKIDQKISFFKNSVNDLRDISNRAVKDELAKVAGYNLENVTELAGTVRVFVRSANESFKKTVTYLKSDKAIDKHIAKIMKDMESKFKWNKKKEGFDESEESFKNFKEFTTKMQVYFRYQSGFYDMMLNGSMKLVKMYINISSQFLQWGRQTKEYEERKAARNNNYQESRERRLTPEELMR